jgi:hypothetical protein
VATDFASRPLHQAPLPWPVKTTTGLVRWPMVVKPQNFKTCKSVMRPSPRTDDMRVEV